MECVEMPRSRLVYLAVASLSLLAAGDTANDPDLLDRNRRLLDKWRSDPDHIQRLQRDWAAFRELPPPRQQQMRELDQQLHALEAPVQQRLLNTAERYADWHTRLPDDDRKRVDSAAERAAKLSVIR